MPRSSAEQLYVRKITAETPEGIQLPIRYLSDDGECAIDVDYYRDAPVSVEAKSSDYAIRSWASNILQDCVSPLGQGGFAYPQSEFP